MVRHLNKNRVLRRFGLSKALGTLSSLRKALFRASPQIGFFDPRERIEFIRKMEQHRLGPIEWMR